MSSLVIVVLTCHGFYMKRGYERMSWDDRGCRFQEGTSVGLVRVLGGSG